MKKIRRHLADAPPVFFELSEEGLAIYKECWAMTRGNFQIYAQLTDTLDASGNRVIPWLVKPRHRPGVAIGWQAALFPKKLFLPSVEVGIPKLEIEATPTKMFKFTVVVDPKVARVGLIAILRNALATLRLGELNASSAGLMI